MVTNAYYVLWWRLIGQKNSLSLAWLYLQTWTGDPGTIGEHLQALSQRCEARPSAFLNLWGTMLLQFIFSVYVDLGSSVRFTLQGLFGTSLAYLNRDCKHSDDAKQANKAVFAQHCRLGRRSANMDDSRFT